MALKIPGFGLEGKVAIVAGGGRGIGLSTVLYLAGAGATVAVVDIDEGRAKEAARQVNGAGGRAISILADVRVAAQAEAMVARTLEELKRLDVLVNIVGLASWNPALEMTEETWNKDILGNLSYAFFMSKAAAKAMVAQGSGGAIVSTASISGVVAAPMHVAYGAAKAGLIGLTKSLAVEWGPYQIRVNAVAPGGTRTPRVVELAGVQFDEQAKRSVPMGHPAETTDIAAAMLFFASDLASHVTGQVLAVDGGHTLNIYQREGQERFRTFHNAPTKGAMLP